MIKLVKHLFLLLCTTIALSPGADKCSLTIEINGLKNSKGAVLISLYDNKEAFPKDAARAVHNEKVTISNGKAKVTITNLNPGTYAVALLHDENNNLKMDFNIVGMPKEGYGFSNDAQGTFGPPSFEKASFKVLPQKKNISLKMKYFL